MRNSLEKYIQDHRNELDVLEPSPRVWEGIRTEMHFDPTFIKSHASWLKYFGFSASLIAVLVYLHFSETEKTVANPEPLRTEAPVPVDTVTVPKVAEPVTASDEPIAKTEMVKAKEIARVPEMNVPAPEPEITENETNQQPTKPTTMNSTAVKTALLFSALAFDTMAVVSAQDSTSHKNSITQERTVSPFSELSISGVGDIFISQGDKEKVSVTAPQKMQEHIEVVNDGNRLIIRQKKGANHNFKGEVNIYVTLRDISKLHVSGIGKIKTSTPLNLNELHCEISAMGNLMLELNCKKFTAGISAIGNMTLKGHADEASIKLSGMGNLEAGNFEVGKLKASLSGMGNAEVYAKESLVVNASGMGNLIYKGNPPHEEIHSSGMGSVKKN